jgi:hypothetical protein
MNDFMFASRGTGEAEKGGYQHIWRWLWNAVYVSEWTKYLVHQFWRFTQIHVVLTVIKASISAQLEVEFCTLAYI